MFGDRSPVGSLCTGGKAPAEDCFYVPGGWAWTGTTYAWRAGYWARVQPGYVWIPAHYRWSPSGYVYIGGYWDTMPHSRFFLMFVGILIASAIPLSFMVPQIKRTLKRSDMVAAAG